MSKESRLLPPAEERGDLTPETVKSAIVLMYVFGMLTFLAVALAGTLFYSSFMVPEPRIPGILWRLAFLGIVCSFCTLWIHNRIKAYESSEPNSEPHQS